MTTLHALRRGRKLPLSELARLTGIPARRLAEFEYEERPLELQEREAIAQALGVRAQMVTGGLSIATPAMEGGRLNPQQAYLLSALAATAALSLSLHAALPTLSAGLADAFSPPVARPTGLAPTADRTDTGALVARAAAAPLAQSVARATPPQASSSAKKPSTPVARVVVSKAVTGPTPTELPTGTPEPIQPHGCPVVTEQGSVVITQGYGVGTHAPAGVNGAIDLAVDGDGNGYAEPDSTRGAIIVATHAGSVKVELNTWPAGNHVWVDGSDGWRTGYSHLLTIYVKTGDTVTAGQPLGVIGNTGLAGGPHLDIQVWRDGRNVDPTGMLKCR